MIDAELCYEAVRSRDARFDGRFFTGVKTTGIYCRPICPSRTPKRENVAFFATTAAAEADGFRPCLRCRPETAPGTPAWHGTSASVSRALRLIEESSGEIAVDTLASRLGMTDRHLRRLFLDHLGTTPIGVIQTQRAHLARRLLTDTALPMTDVAFGSGFASIRRFNDAIRNAYGCTPGELRAGARPAREGAVSLELTYRAPVLLDPLFAFLAQRAIRGVEEFDGGVWRRAARAGSWTGVISIARKSCETLELRMPPSAARSVHSLVARAKHALDVAADPAAIASHLAADPVLRPLVRRFRGLRVPHAWDPFETAVRAVVGQQVSVAAATTILSRIAASFGTETAEGLSLFPAAEVLANVTVTGMPASRSATIRALAQAVADDPSLLERASSLDASVERLCAIKGIGEWTANYIAMRVIGEPDAFPVSDLGLRKAAARLGIDDLESHAERWRPWRAYAAMILWESLT